MELVARHTLPATEHPACGLAAAEPTDFTLTFGSTRNVVGVVSGENGDLVEEAKEETETSVNGKGAQSRESGGSTDEESNAVSESGDHNREARNSESLTQLQASAHSRIQLVRDAHNHEHVIHTHPQKKEGKKFVDLSLGEFEQRTQPHGTEVSKQATDNA